MPREISSMRTRSVHYLRIVFGDKAKDNSRSILPKKHSGALPNKYPLLIIGNFVRRVVVPQLSAGGSDISSPRGADGGMNAVLGELILKTKNICPGGRFVIEFVD